MKSSYEARALKFAYTLVALFADCLTYQDFRAVIMEYNRHHSRQLNYSCGVSRMVIIRADYVIKFDMKPEGMFSNGCAGNNATEAEVYARSVVDGYEYLLAKPTCININGRDITIMPRISRVNDESRYYVNYCTDDEYDWLCENINDLHEGNLGYRNGKVCVIDYAWDATSENQDYASLTTPTSAKEPMSSLEFTLL